jgi:hypothetical protein
MARKGVGNFDSDTASDYASDLVERLTIEVERAFATPGSIDPDEYYGEMIPAIVEIISVLHRLSGTAAIPSPDVVNRWKTQFLLARDKTLAHADSAGDKRRSVINNTFDELLRHSHAVHEDSN